ncbi:chromosome partitioning protein ParB [Vibrio sp. 10N.286.49.B3]|uniref:ParB/RepB/Spo0J family partition protein n=1 Tax=Vibrio sp. 10N.286.49.B3 TaxID=1880855 RepID=UPI000C82C92B|nr:ParB/RepB/Spo0J family partition protein [Vibrio sp. 10N.286.49.B3]PMH45412.1 chromosome partitioning protein ParB [Vibrio sp. 10N.286.49.B3]
MSKRGLGKGLDALLATSSLAREKQQTASQSQTLSANGTLMDLPIHSLRSGVYQPRKSIEPEALEELAASIQSQGIIQPIVVRQIGDAVYEIIAGERRWRAAKQAGLTQVTCLVKNVQDKAAMAMALIENIQREDLNVIEESQALERLQDEFELTHKQIAEVIGKSRTTVSNLLRLNQLEESVKSLVAEHQLDMGHARALLALKNDEQTKAAEQVVAKKLTVRQTENMVKRWVSPRICGGESIHDVNVQQMSYKLSKVLDAKVSIVNLVNGKAKVTISVDTHHKIEQLIAKLES